MPTSMQEPAPGAKSSKFVGANPLAPMADPFQQNDDGQRDVQQQLAENVNKRLTKAMGELQEKHANGTNEVDDPDRAPTGTPYRQIQQQQQQAALAAKQREAQQMEAQQREETERETWRQKVYQREQDGLEDDDSQEDNKNDNNNSDDDEYDDLLDDDYLDDDPVLEAIRHKRMLELKIAQAQHTEALAKGHGQYRTIAQDEFLPECTGSSEWVAIHFFHREFQRCAIMDHHLQQVATAHVTCKFLRIDAEKAPFFVSKLVIRTLPTLIVFREGKAVDRLVGFEGLAESADADNFATSKLKAWLASTGCIDYDITKDALVREELLEERRAGRHGAIYSSAHHQFDDLHL